MKKTIYVCGPTVYNDPHIGNLKPIIIFDIYIKSLKSLGYKVNFIHNITDIDDKIISKSIEENKTEKEISDKYTKLYKDLLKQSNVDKPSWMPSVIENMPLIINFINSLIKLGFAYISNGNVYFSISKDSKYGYISNRKIEDMIFEDFSENKENKEDFALWKKTDIGITFDSPWGKGRPGWHTECAAFINKIGKLDIHGGGSDLIFPHNENEASQFRVLNKCEITKEWKHIGQININNIKMSKSLGNIINAQDFFKKYGSNTLRLLFLISSPTKPFNINEDIIIEANTKMKFFLKKAKQAQLNSKIEVKNNTIAKYIKNWNFSKAIELLNKNSKLVNLNSDNKINQEFLANLKVLGLINKENEISIKEKEIFNKWEHLKSKKMYKEADLIREKLIKIGFL
ncbi:MAG: cysteine--tRNA ligase [Mycoplasma sp.]|nr:cysteine--tRNA ligase [Mycoplasma sp.]